MISSIPNRSLIRVGEAVTWVAPALGIPVLRYFQDDPRERRRLFIRDFSTYTVGAATYFICKLAALKLLKSRVPSAGHRELYSLIAGVAGNITFAGIGAVRVSRFLDRILNRKPSQHVTSPEKLSNQGIPASFGAMAGNPPGGGGLINKSPTGAFDVFTRR